MPLDFGKLAATISLASEALAAAAEALAEAAGAMSAASSTFNSPKDISKSPIIVNSAASTPESLTSEKDETITGESKDSPSQVAQHTSVASQTTYRFDRSISATSGPPPMPPIASPSGEKELPPVQLSSGARTSYPFPQSVPKVISSFTDATLERETNNKHTNDGRHPSPVVPIPDQPQMALTQASEKSRAHPELDALQLLEVMRSYPSFPPGKNYIHLDQPSDALAFIAYMALQARRVVCMVPTSLPNAHVQILLRNIASQLLSETPVNPAPPRSLIPPPPPPLLQPPTSQSVA
ncbi:unnamed protein product [Rhizoctonia solani]|uniref:Uncharacterized protein n=1 Tax=Rhizoctonia solani TaxID=456999 RepID=A0A8H3G7I4_9AGAM|nr:unnamed protein product [Rhizoctonia solani]